MNHNGLSPSPRLIVGNQINSLLDLWIEAITYDFVLTNAITAIKSDKSSGLFISYLELNSWLLEILHCPGNSVRGNVEKRREESRKMSAELG